MLGRVQIEMYSKDPIICIIIIHASMWWLLDLFFLSLLTPYKFRRKWRLFVRPYSRSAQVAILLMATIIIIQLITLPLYLLYLILSTLYYINYVKY